MCVFFGRDFFWHTERIECSCRLSSYQPLLCICPVSYTHLDVYKRQQGYSTKYGIKKEFSKAALEELKEYHWPGNVRELENTVHRLYILEKGKIIDSMTVDMLINESIYEFEAVDIRKENSADEKMDFNQIMDKQEKKLIAFALEKCKTTRAAADFLNIPQATFARKKIKHQL